MDSALVLIAIGVLFLAGLALDALGRRVHVPRVTLLILLGVLLGPPVLDLLPLDVASANEAFAPTALTMIAFLLGGTLNARAFAAHGRDIITMSLAVVLVSGLVVGGGLMLIGAPLIMALLLGAISAATDPAATHDVVMQSGRTGRFSTMLLGIVAIDDVWGILVFSIALSLAGAAAGNGAGGAMIEGMRELGGAVAVGAAIGVPAAFLTGRLKRGEPTLIEALGVVFLTAGAALWLEVSFLLAGIVCGAVIVNFARHHDRPFHEIERIGWPFQLLFFVMAGASLDVVKLEGAGLLALGYIVLRGLGRVAGGWLGGRLIRRPGREGVLTGMSLMPQAGVAVGMALVADETFPGVGETILAITIASTIAFEVIGPVFAQIALNRVGEDGV